MPPSSDLNKTRQPAIGILGGGQLALMLSRAASQLGITTRILEPVYDCPARPAVAECIQGSWDDDSTLQAFADGMDIITLENEFVDISQLQKLEALGHTVYPSSATMGLVQDKLIQKQTLLAAGIPVVDFIAVTEESGIDAAVTAMGLPCVMKRRTLGYDGTGNFTLKSADDVAAGMEKLTRGKDALLYVERWCPFVMEVAVMVTRSAAGETVAYPVVETRQTNHVCSAVIAPAQVSAELAAEAQSLAVRAVQAINGVGTFGIEFFLLESDVLLVNEIAPRVHNSGHYTSEACDCSQFENHVRAISGLPLGSTAMRRPAAMVNILATCAGGGSPAGLRDALQVAGASVHLYGKPAAKPGRKMGHVTALGPDSASALETAEAAARCIHFLPTNE